MFAYRVSSSDVIRHAIDRCLSASKRDAAWLVAASRLPDCRRIRTRRLRCQLPRRRRSASRIYCRTTLFSLICCHRPVQLPFSQLHVEMTTSCPAPTNLFWLALSTRSTCLIAAFVPSLPRRTSTFVRIHQTLMHSAASRSSLLCCQCLRIVVSCASRVLYACRFLSGSDSMLCARLPNCR